MAPRKEDAPTAELDGQLSIDDILEGGTWTHRFPWHDVAGATVVQAIAELCAAGCSLYLGTVGYGVLGQVRVYTPEGALYSAVCHTSEEMYNVLRALGSPDGPRWVAQNATKPARGRRR